MIEHRAITISKTKSKSIHLFSQNRLKHVSGHDRFSEANFSRTHSRVPSRLRLRGHLGCLEALPKGRWPALPLSPLPKANGLRQTGERVQWPGQGDLGWNLRLRMFSIMLVAITIAWDDAGKKLSKRRPEKPPALNSSSREVDSRVEALRFDRRAGALGLHLCGFSKPLWLFFFFWPRINFQNQFSKPIFTMGFWKSTKN